MADEFNKTFSSTQEEIQHWKSLCMKYKERLVFYSSVVSMIDISIKIFL